MATYEEIMAKARELAAAGDTAGAKRLGEIAIGMRGQEPVSTGDEVRARMQSALSSQPTPESLARTEAANVESERMMAMPDVSRLEAAITGAGQGATFGFADEMTAGLASLSPNLTYEDALGGVRERLEAGRELHPKTALGAEVGGALLTGLAAGPAVTAKTALGKAGQAAGIGLGEGSLYGFGVGEGGAENRAKSAATTGALGAVTGGALSLGGSGIGAIVDKLKGSKAARGMVSSTPSVDELKAAAGDLYDEAQRSGITATPQYTRGFADDMQSMAAREGIITPSGRVAKGMVNVSDALNMIDDYAGEAMDPAQMRAVRLSISDAAQSNVPREARIGSQMIKEFDEFTSPMTPTIANANKLYTQAMRGNVVDEAVELAGVRAGQFSGSGYENALRTEFRRLSRDIVKGRLKGLSPDQVASIRRVADGGPIENLARGVGKAAPTGIVNVAAGGGMPFMIGNAIGGPGVGLAAGLGTMTAGTMGRSAATSMQKQNAAIAGALMRGGKTPPLSSTNIPLSAGRSNAAVNAVIASLLAGQRPTGATSQ